MKKLVLFVFVFLLSVSNTFGANETIVIKELNLELVKCPPGSFMMGSPEEEHSRIKKEIDSNHKEAYGFEYSEELHSVNINKAFYIGKYEVTQRQYEAIMGNNPSKFKDDNNPVESIDWVKAKLFCARLNSLYKKHLPKGYKFDLPTEEQWEYACRASISTTFKDRNNNFDNIDEVAWYSDNASNTTHMVGQKIPNAWGIYDMQGNVWEWCKDVYIDYKEKGKITVHLNNNKYVIRGGSWINNSSYCRSTTRLCDYYSFYSNILGFRVAIVSIG